MKWQKESLEEMIIREEYYNSADDDELTLTKLKKLTAVSLYLITFSYEYKLLLRLGTTLFYTHGFFDSFD